MADANGNGARERRDAAARERALDITQSFLVQAPAGSGKTGLLIQRYLALLAHVDRPERIVAMTFTRKAAAEMRERVLKALRDAEDATAVDASRPHDVAVRRLALAALAQDRRFDWQMLAQPSRLRMLTIDALAASLARQAPVTTGLGALPEFIDDAAPVVPAGRTLGAGRCGSERSGMAALSRARGQRRGQGRPVADVAACAPRSMAAPAVWRGGRRFARPARMGVACRNRVGAGANARHVFGIDCDAPGRIRNATLPANSRKPMGWKHQRMHCCSLQVRVEFRVPTPKICRSGKRWPTSC